MIPLGDDFWRSTAVSFGAEMPNRWLDVITGQHLESSHAGATQALSLSSVFSHFPVALLYQEQVSTRPSLRQENMHAAGVQHSTT
jgi:maltooligosyltrehalose synthase